MGDSPHTMNAEGSDATLRVGVGMRGGLDSSVVAALLKEQGYDVIGLTLHLFREGSRCCSIEDIERSRRVCDKLGIPHSIIQAVDFFRSTIIEPFVEEFVRGRTPSPCVMCNQYVKFGALHDRALQLGCARVATGHYVRVEEREGRFHLLRGRDAKKDQSYFLHRLSQDQLSRRLFPLERWAKTEVAAYAEQTGLPVSVSSKSESQDLCFVPDEGHAPLVESYHPELNRTGEIVDDSGRVLGDHAGYHRYTIGQRKGLGVAAASRLYVKDIDPAANRLVVGPRDELFTRRFRVDDIHWIAGVPPTEPMRCSIRVRYRTPAADADVDLHGGTSASVRLDEPQFAVTPGQAAVFYDGDEVLGGGWIGGRV